MSDFKKIARLAIPYKKYVFLNIFFNVLSAFFSTLSLIAMAPVLKVIFEDGEKIYKEPVYKGFEGLKDYFEQYVNYLLTVKIAAHGTFVVLMYIIGLIVTIFLLKNLTTYLAVYFITYLRNGLIKDIRETMYNKIVRLPASYYSATTKGDIIARLTGDVNEISGSLQNMLEMVVKEPLTILFTLAGMLLFSVKLTLFVFLFIPIAGFLVSQVGKTLKKKSMLLQQEQGQILSILEETVSGLKIIKSFTAEAVFGKKFNAASQRLFEHSNTVSNKQNLASPMSEFLGIIIISILLVYGGFLVFEDRSMEAGFFITYIVMAYNILTPAKDISKASYALKRGTASAERIVQILDADVTIQDHPEAVAKESFEGDVRLNNITFSYDNNRNVLENFTLNIPKGKTVALVGQSGSGKSTIANLLTRFYDVQGGSITIDGIDIKEMKLHDVRGMTGLVTQSSILFNDSIRNNMLVAKPDATNDEIISALKVANAYEFVEGLEHGIDTNIGDGGGMLSGGQQQRISIARAVLKNPPIMILDEATSALDTESERLVQQALDNMMKNRTSVVIAHRLSTIQKADKIVVMEKGRIVEQGTHDELIAHSGTYHKLVMMQSFE
jgi:subfamily B ATP-binding cassette protein MsbA